MKIKPLLFKFIAFVFLFLQFSFLYSQTKTISLEEIYRNNTFRQRSVQGIRSMNDGLHYTTLEEGQHIVKYSYQTGRAVDTLLSLHWNQQYYITSIFDYELSSDEKKIVVSTNVMSIYRHSYLADFYV